VPVITKNSEGTAYENPGFAEKNIVKKQESAL
jgi:hypothetical protein